MKKINLMLMILVFSVSGYSADAKIYKNSKYGFEISFPESWNGYKMVELSTKWPAGITAATWYVCLPTKDSTYSESKDYPAGYAPVVAFTLFTHEQFRKIKEDNEKNKDIIPVEDIEIYKQNKKYIINYSEPQSLPPHLHERLGEISRVMGAFKFIDLK